MAGWRMVAGSMVAVGLLGLTAVTEARTKGEASPPGATRVRELQALAPTVAYPPGCVIAASDVIGWWRGENTLAASIGPILAGSATYGAGPVGQAMSFDGMTSGSTGNLSTVSTGLTVQMWIKPTDTGGPGQRQTLASRWDFPSTDDSARSFALFLDPGGALVWTTDDTSTRRPEELDASAPALVDGAFHHVAATWDAAEMTVYVDGSAVATKPSQGGMLNPASAAPFVLAGKSGLGPQFPYGGAIDEPMVVRRALTATEVVAAMAAGANAVCGPIVISGSSTATSGASVRWKGTNSGNDVYIGPMLGPSALPRVEARNPWSPGTDFPVSVVFDPVSQTLRETASGIPDLVFDLSTGGAPGCPTTGWNTVDLSVQDQRTDAGIQFLGVQLDGAPLGDFGVLDVGGKAGFQAWTVNQYDFSHAFTLTGTIHVAGTGFVGNEALKVQVTVGCV
jgi:hypothetical protein